VPAAEFVPAPTLRKIDQSEVDLVAGVWLSKLSTRPTGQQAIPLLQRFNPQDIGAAIDLVSKDKRFSERDTHYRAISEVLWGRSLDTLASTLNNEAEQLRADREARNASR